MPSSFQVHTGPSSSCKVVHVSLPFGSWLWAGKAVIHSTVSFACANAQFGFVSNVGATEWDLFHLEGPISLSAAELELVFNSILLGCEFIKWDYTVKCTPSSTDESVWMVTWPFRLFDSKSPANRSTARACFKVLNTLKELVGRKHLYFPTGLLS